MARTVSVEAKSLLQSAETVFCKETPVSDHLPQTFRVAVGIASSTAEAQTGNGAAADVMVVDLLCWNVMCRGRAGEKGKAGSILQGRTLTNNGLECNETPQEYEERLLSSVSPVIAKWIAEGKRSRKGAPAAAAAMAGKQDGSLKLVCLQEFPAQPLLQDAVLQKLKQLSGCNKLTAAARPSQVLLDVVAGSPTTASDEADGGSALHTCTAVLWDDDDLPDGLTVRVVHSLGSTKDAGKRSDVGALGLLLQTSGEAPPMESGRMIWRTLCCSVHFPFIDSPTGARYHEAKTRAEAAITQLHEQAVRMGAGALIVAGDLNIDAQSLVAASSSSDALGLASACFPESSTFRGTRMTMDACVAAQLGVSVAAAGLLASGGEEVLLPDADVDLVSASGTVVPGSLLRTGLCKPFFGFSKETFLKARVAHGLQDDPRVWGLGETALASLGLWPFADQAALLPAMLAADKAAKQKERKAQSMGSSAKRRRLANPFQSGAAGAQDEEESDETDSESESESGAVSQT